MSEALELVKRAYKAWETKDVETLRTILHKNYQAKMPGGMSMNFEEAQQCLLDCPMETHPENEMYIVDGNNIVRIWDMVTTSPSPFRVRMAELNVVEGDKILANEAVFNVGDFPKEMQEQFAQECNKKQEAHA